jgi:hypothetical protein
MHAMVSMARVAQPAAKDDATIREKLLAEFQKEIWAPVTMTNVVVVDGVVELWGVIVDERQRQAMKVAAENISGVKAVNDHLVWVEPTSGMVIEPRDEAVALLDELKEHSTQPKYQYRLKYGVGDVVIWDNASLLHSATLTDPDDPRTLWRITVKEEGRS